jgi:hypothetical protein
VKRREERRGEERREGEATGFKKIQTVACPPLPRTYILMDAHNGTHNDKKRSANPMMDPENRAPEAKRPKSHKVFVPDFYQLDLTVNGTSPKYREYTFDTCCDTYTLCRFSYKYHMDMSAMYHPHYHDRPGIYVGGLSVRSDCSTVSIDLVVDSEVKQNLEVVTIGPSGFHARSRQARQGLLAACGIALDCSSHAAIQKLSHELHSFCKNIAPAHPGLFEDLDTLCFELDIGPDGVTLGYSATITFLDRVNLFSAPLYHTEKVFVSMEQMAEVNANVARFMSTSLGPVI